MMIKIMIMRMMSTMILGQHFSCQSLVTHDAEECSDEQHLHDDHDASMKILIIILGLDFVGQGLVAHDAEESLDEKHLHDDHE